MYRLRFVIRNMLNYISYTKYEEYKIGILVDRRKILDPRCFHIYK